MAFGMGPGMQPINLGIGAEIIYSFVVIFCSLMIYFGTKEIYELSSYRGIKYFRLAFLFLGFAYFIRLFLQILMTYFNLHEILEFYPMAIGYLVLASFMYFSMMSIFYLIASVLSKNLKGNSKVIYGFHIVAVVVALVTVFFNNSMFYLGLSVLLFISAGVSIYLSSHNSKFKSKKNRFDTVYILFLIFLILNIINILVPAFLQTIKLLVYLISLSIFFIMVYKVLKKAGN